MANVMKNILEHMEHLVKQLAEQAELASHQTRSPQSEKTKESWMGAEYVPWYDAITKILEKQEKEKLDAIRRYHWSFWFRMLQKHYNDEE